MDYHHLTTYERSRIEVLHKLGNSNRKIALSLGRHRSSIDRELSRNSCAETYQAEQAEQDYLQRRTNSRPNGKCSDVLVAIVKGKLLATWSPE